MSSYDVHIWSIRKYKGTKKTTYTVRWTVVGQEFSDTFDTAALAESFRAKLLTAARDGMPFDETAGLPESMVRELNVVSWYEHAVEFVDMKWTNTSARHREGIAEALTTATLALLPSQQGGHADDVLRKALRSWSFNTAARAVENPPTALAAAVRWLSENTPRLTVLTDAVATRRLLDRLALKLDGTIASASTTRRKRAIVSSALLYAVELNRLETHPFEKIRWSAPKSTDEVDLQVVVNPGQARRLLDAVRTKDPDLVAFFACMYFAALRPAEVVHLRANNLTLPKQGWGKLHLTGSTQEVGAEWADDGQSREERGLKHRARRATRLVPASPELVAILREHLDLYGTGPDGRLFVTRRGRGGGKDRPAARVIRGPALPIGSNRYSKAWKDARQAGLTAEEAASPLAGRPYDLRHAAVSLWLSAGVPPTQVAEWAGHSVRVLLTVYAKCIAGQGPAAQRMIDNALNSGEDPERDPTT